MPNNVKVLLVGAGEMAIEYARVLKDINVPFEVIGRGENSALSFENATGLKVQRGGIEAVAFDHVPTHAIIAVGVEQLRSVTEYVLNLGLKKVLVEKPGGLYKDDIKQICEVAKITQSEVYVAYNRRFYASTKRALEIIEQDGGVKSFSFEFTEWPRVIESLKTSQLVKEEWIYANSSHVIDLAFFLGGNPKEMICYSQGELSWHKKGSSFAGAGISEKGALFSYHADWNAPGRWSVEVLTTKHRLYFKPMEQLHIQEKNSVKVENVDIDDALDKKYKPGLYEEIYSFLYNPHDPRLTTIQNQLINWRCYERIENG